MRKKEYFFMIVYRHKVINIFSLYFQFLQKQYDGILDLAASVDITAKADWELRLYSCDERKLQ